MKNYYVSLDNRDLVLVSGKDSVKFLQGQLTCDLSSLNSPDSCLGCVCNNKGRVIASFTVWHLNDDYFFEMEKGLGDILINHLEKYSVFYKVEITKASDRYLRKGFYGPEIQHSLTKIINGWPSEDRQVIQLNEHYIRLVDKTQQRFELWLDNRNQNKDFHLLLDEMTETNTQDWTLLDQQLGLYYMKPEDSSLYTPEELNYDLLGHISFTKGCYTGQEIVARMHYRGKSKKRLKRIQIHSNEAPDKLMTLCSENKKAVGQILQVIQLAPNEFEALAITIGNESNGELSLLEINALKINHL